MLIIHHPASPCPSQSVPASCTVCVEPSNGCFRSASEYALNLSILTNTNHCHPPFPPKRLTQPWAAISKFSLSRPVLPRCSTRITSKFHAAALHCTPAEAIAGPDTGPYLIKSTACTAQEVNGFFINKSTRGKLEPPPRLIAHLAALRQNCSPVHVWRYSSASRPFIHTAAAAMDHMNFQIPGMGPPPIMNQPPRIFGGYGPDGMANASQMPADLAAHMFPDTHLLMEDTNEAKRRRIARVRESPHAVRSSRMLTLRGS